MLLLCAVTFVMTLAMCGLLDRVDVPLIGPLLLLSLCVHVWVVLAAVSMWLVGLFVNAVLRNLQASIDAEEDPGKGKGTAEEAPDEEAIEQMCKSFDKTPMMGLLSIVDAIGASLPQGGVGGGAAADVWCLHAGWCACCLVWFGLVWWYRGVSYRIVVSAERGCGVVSCGRQALDDSQGEGAGPQGPRWQHVHAVYDCERW